MLSAQSPQRADFAQRAGERLRRFVDLRMGIGGLVRGMAVDAMKAHLRDFPADGPEGWIFTAPQGGPVVYTHFMDGSWQPACAKAGIAKGTGPHALRHHYASLLIKHGESVKTVSERLGHTNAAMTLNIYTHLWPDSEERTRAAVDKAYGGSGTMRCERAVLGGQTYTPCLAVCWICCSTETVACSRSR